MPSRTAQFARLILAGFIFCTPALAQSEVDSASSGTSVLIPAGIPEFDIYYDYFERLHTSSPAPFAGEPVLLQYLRDGHEPARYGFLSNNTDDIGIFGLLTEDFTARKYQRGQGFEAIRIGFRARPHERLHLYGNFVLDEERAENPAHTGKKWRGLAGDVEQAYALYDVQSKKIGLTLAAGRFASFFGPHRSLIVGAHRPLDGFRYTFRLGSRIALTYHLARLDGRTIFNEGFATTENRYFAAHRLDVRLHRNLDIGAFEAIVFGGVGRSIDLYYLNPFLFYHGTQLNEQRDDNTILGLDLTWRFRPGYRLYGQLAVDDFQIENESQGDQEPDQYGLLLGAHAVRLIGTIDVQAEYSRVTNWTYNQIYPRNRFLFDDEPLADVPGNDFDKFELWFNYWPDVESYNELDGIGYGSLRLAYIRRGEGRVDAPWTAPWLETEGDYDEPFPTGTVEKTMRLSIQTSGYLPHFPAFLLFNAGLEQIQNFAHVSGDDRTVPFARVRLTLYADFPIGLE